MPADPTRPTLLIATTSQGKLRELRQLLGDLPAELATLRDVGIDGDVEETGTTFLQNARIKAEAYGRLSGLLTLAEDSGLEVRALDNQPGVYSARWEGDDYARKNRILVERLAGKAGVERAARYVSAIVLRHPDGRTWTARGELRGQIAREPAGEGGFGYDPVFYIPRWRATLAQVGADAKNRISHRGRAAGRIVGVLRDLLERRDGV